MEEILNRLAKSRFRAGFTLNYDDIEYIDKAGFEKIGRHAKDFIINRLAPANPGNDGKQTPFKGHPVFKAQHATATCCRKCLNKWHKIPEGRDLSAEEIDFIAGLILKWIKMQSIEIRDRANLKV